MEDLFVKSERKFIPVDEWIPGENECFIKHVKGALVIPVANIFGFDNQSFNYFILSPKRCYSNEDNRAHIAHYLNYLINFYDEDMELISVYSNIKYLIDCEECYTKEALFYDLIKYLLSGSMFYKITLMNRDNYSLDLHYDKAKTSCLEYNNKHGLILSKISLMMIVTIPLLTHFCHQNKIANSDELLLEFYDKILQMITDLYGVDICSKLYETAASKTERNKKRNPIWNMQDIRGKNPTTHILNCVSNILLNIMPRYQYCKNIVFFNLTSIERNAKFQITDIGYDCDFISLSSSNRDEDNNSEFDKFESYLTKQDEALYLQNKVNCEETMRQLEAMYGPFDEKEIQFYKKNLEVDGEFVINKFQKELLFNPFYKFFGDPVSINAINSDDYIKLILIAKKIFEANGMVVLPYIISGKINRFVYRKNVNKKELMKLESSSFYTAIMNKYKSEKVKKEILTLIATILSSEFQIIDYENPDLHGQIVHQIPEFINHEILMYINLI